MDEDEVTLLAILYTDGCLSRKSKNSQSWRFFLGNTSWPIIQAFKKSMMRLYSLPEKRIRISKKQVNGKPFYKAVVDSVEIGQLLTKKYGTFRTLKFGNKYPPASLPETLKNDSKTICQFLKVAFSCDGGINLYVARSRYKFLIRNVYLACQHPILRKQYFEFLKKLNIASKILEKDELIRIQGKESLKRFASLVGFMSGVKITQNSAYWQGFEKQKLLELAVSSYGNPRAIYNLPQFGVKI